MTKLRHAVTINAPLEKVWGVLTNLDEVAQYNKTVDSAWYTSEHKTGVGASRECKLDKGSVKESVTDVQMGKSISMELTESDWPLKYMRWTTEVDTQSDGSTKVTQTTEYEPGMGLLGKLMDTMMMKRKFNGILSGLFDDMKEYVEKKD